MVPSRSANALYVAASVPNSPPRPGSETRASYWPAAIWDDAAATWAMERWTRRLKYQETASAASTAGAARCRSRAAVPIRTPAPRAGLGGHVRGSGLHQVAVEDAGADRGGDQPGGQCPGGQHQRLGHQQPSRQARPAGRGCCRSGTRRGSLAGAHPVADPSDGAHEPAFGRVSPSLRRRCPTWTSTRCSSPTHVGPHTVSMSWRRLNAIRGRSNSAASRRTRCGSRRSTRPPARRRGRPGRSSTGRTTAPCSCWPSGRPKGRGRRSIACTRNKAIEPKRGGLFLLGDTLRRNGRPGEGLPYLEQAQAIWLKKPPTNQRDLVDLEAAIATTRAALR